MRPTKSSEHALGVAISLLWGTPPFSPKRGGPGGRGTVTRAGGVAGRSAGGEAPARSVRPGRGPRALLPPKLWDLGRPPRPPAGPDLLKVALARILGGLRTCVVGARRGAVGTPFVAAPEAALQWAVEKFEFPPSPRVGWGTLDELLSAGAPPGRGAAPLSGRT